MQHLHAQLELDQLFQLCPQPAQASRKLGLCSAWVCSICAAPHLVAEWRSQCGSIAIKAAGRHAGHSAQHTKYLLVIRAEILLGCCQSPSGCWNAWYNMCLYSHLIAVKGARRHAGRSAQSLSHLLIACVKQLLGGCQSPSGCWYAAQPAKCMPELQALQANNTSQCKMLFCLMQTTSTASGCM